MTNYAVQPTNHPDKFFAVPCNLSEDTSRWIVHGPGCVIDRSTVKFVMGEWTRGPYSLYGSPVASELRRTFERLYASDETENLAPTGRGFFNLIMLSEHDANNQEGQPGRTSEMKLNEYLCPSQMIAATRYQWSNHLRQYVKAAETSYYPVLPSENAIDRLHQAADKYINSDPLFSVLWFGAQGEQTVKSHAKTIMVLAGGRPQMLFAITDRRELKTERSPIESLINPNDLPY